MKLSAMHLVALVGLLSTELVTAGDGNTDKPLEANEVQTRFLKSVKVGAWRGINECERLFNSSWRLNCSFVRNFVDPNLPIFVNAKLPYATPETAFIHAISSAAITYELTPWCRGDVSGKKSMRIKKKKICYLRKKKGSNWGYNFELGQNETKRLFDDLETGNNARTAMNLHNNKVGREMVAINHTVQCKVEGQSRQSTRSSAPCHRLTPLKTIGAELRKKYHNAVRVWFFNNKLHEKVGTQFKAISSEDTRLVYLEPSPDACVKNESIGVPGMRGKTCLTFDNMETKCESFVSRCSSCQLNSQTTKRVMHFQCNCKFHWCCYVKCENCQKTYFETTCFGNPQTRVY